MFVKGCRQGRGHAGGVDVVLVSGQRVMARVLCAVRGYLHEVAPVSRAHRQGRACTAAKKKKKSKQT